MIPWRFGRASPKTLNLAIYDSSGTTIASLKVESDRTAELRTQHARLIAAAPELLAVLQKIADRNLTYLGGYVMGEQIPVEEILEARMVIAIATGEKQ